MTKVWVTTWALTDGIFIVDAGPAERHLEGDDLHMTEHAALDYAHEMRRAKLEFLRREVARLEALTFPILEQKP